VSRLPTGNRAEFTKELQGLINRYSQENGSDTPDFILAEHLVECLEAFERITDKRDKWWGHRHWTELSAGDGQPAAPPEAKP
jgi:hypothetical protein